MNTDPILFRHSRCLSAPARGMSHPVSTAPTRSNAAASYQVALELLEAGETDRALVQLHEQHAQDANFVPTCLTLGRIYASKGNLTEAEWWYEYAIKLDKLQPESYCQLALIYQEQGKLDAAVEALRKAIYLNHDLPLAHYNLAQLYARQQQKELAYKSWQNVQRLLAGKAKSEPLSEGDGLVVGQLLELVEAHLTKNA